jgi:hypothetical protein
MEPEGAGGGVAIRGDALVLQPLFGVSGYDGSDPAWLRPPLCFGP